MVHYGLRVQGLRIKKLREIEVFFFEICSYLFFKCLRLGEIHDPHACPCHLVFIARADSPAGCAYSALALGILSGQINGPVVRHYKMSLVAQGQPPGGHLNPRFFQIFDLFQKHFRINHNPISNKAFLVFIKNTGRN